MGILEIAIVLVIALIVFGPKRLPDLGRSLGKGIREFREGVSHIGSDNDDHDELGDLDRDVAAGDPREPAHPEPAEQLESGAVEVEVEEITSGPKASDSAPRD